MVLDSDGKMKEPVGVSGWRNANKSYQSRVFGRRLRLHAFPVMVLVRFPLGDRWRPVNSKELRRWKLTWSQDDG